MKVAQVRSDEERAILTALIVNDGVLATVHARLGSDRNPFEGKWANTIAQWCFAYYGKYRKAPKKHIQNLFAKYSQKTKDEDAVTLVDQFLSRLNKDYEGLSQELNEKYLIDLASTYFKRVRLARMSERLQAAVDNKDIEEAETALHEYKPVEFAADDWADPFSKDEIRQTFRYYEKDRSLIRFPGELDRFLSEQFERDGFIAFAAPEKRGKSYFLLEVVYQALRQRRKVLYYVLGDMSKVQAQRRLYQRIARRPIRTGEFRLPKRMFIKDGVPRVKFRNKLRAAITPKVIWEMADKLRRLTSSNELPIKIKCHGASIVAASDIERDVQECSQEGWVPDVVVLDYADLLAPEPGTGTQEFRHQVNESWKVLRRIALDHHLLMCTATQAAATAYDSRVIRKRDFSEDKRKNAHVTGMLGINQTSEEKPLGIYRLNWIFLRDGAWADTEVVWTAGNLGIACPCMVSAM